MENTKGIQVIVNDMTKEPLPSPQETSQYLTYTRIAAIRLIDNINKFTATNPLDIKTPNPILNERNIAFNEMLQKLSPEMRAYVKEGHDIMSAEIMTKNLQEQEKYKREILTKLRINRIQLPLAQLTIDAINNQNILPNYFDNQVSNINCNVFEKKPNSTDFDSNQKYLHLERESNDHGRSFNVSKIKLIYGADDHKREILLIMEENKPFLLTIEENNQFIPLNDKEEGEVLDELAKNIDDLIKNAVVENRVVSFLRLLRPWEEPKETPINISENPKPKKDKVAVQLARDPDGDFPNGPIMTRGQGRTIHIPKETR